MIRRLKTYWLWDFFQSLSLPPKHSSHICPRNLFSTKTYFSFVLQRTKLPVYVWTFKGPHHREPKRPATESVGIFELQTTTWVGDLNTSNLGHVPSSRASLHGSSSSSQFLRPFPSSTRLLPEVFLKWMFIRFIAIFYYKVFKVLTNTNWHCHHSNENWWPGTNADDLVVAKDVV